MWRAMNILSPKYLFFAYMTLVSVPQYSFAQPEQEIKSVALLVTDLSGQSPSKGFLYQSLGKRRMHVADVDEHGKPDRAVKCKPTQKFEAKADSSFDRPVSPVQILCAPELTFRFTRMFSISLPADQADQLAQFGSGPQQPFIFGTYADVFSKAGKFAAARAWDEAAILSMVKELGDTKYDKFVFRDPTANFALKLTDEGITAVREKQRALGVEESGVLDVATSGAIARIGTGAVGIGKTPPMRCDAKTAPWSPNAKFLCAPASATAVAAAEKSPRSFVLPQVVY
jgi:hypothetical protein